MSNPAPQLVQKLWNYCNILRDDGLSYGDYVEQLILPSRDCCLKMAEEAFARSHREPRSNWLALVLYQFSRPELLR
jgi:type I restriction enzyme M protein